MAMKQYCTFYIDGFFYGVEVSTVQEVIRYHAMTYVPLAPPTVRGLINLRGQIVTAVDLRTRLGLPPLEEGQPMNVVVHHEEDAVSLLVDEIGDVFEMNDLQCDDPPENLSGPTRNLLRGVYKLDDGLLLILDIGKTLGVDLAA